MADQYNQFGERVVKPDDPAQIKAALKAKPQQPSSAASPPSGSSSPSPGLGGAISDAIGAAAKTFGPQSITQRKSKIDQQTSQALGDQF